MSSQTVPPPLVLRAVEDGIVPGAVVAVGHDPDPVAIGTMAVGGPAMPTDAIMRIQSMTKLVTAVAALRLVDQGSLTLDGPVAPWLPELAAPQVLTTPDGPLSGTVPAARPITVRHLLTNTSGYGMILADSPLQHAMAENGTEAGLLPSPLGADAWLAALAELPLVGQPGEIWRYHHSFSLLGILLARLAGTSAGEHLASSLFEPLGMVDTGYSVPVSKRERLPALCSWSSGELVELEELGGGPHVGPPSEDVSHGELLSTAPDYLRFLRALRDGELLSPELLAMLRSDQVPPAAKHSDSFFPGFWDRTGWGFGVGVTTGDPHRGRWGWSGGAGTDFFVDPDGRLGLLLTQVEMGPWIEPLLGAYGAVETR
ncbi:serine hydrolase domain-containing protein [Brachybacterium sp. AOP42-C2-15]|uniref:serine hydrolase domain-containing protein n=1 Tax=unclassified Brachybacterium TaxID=2623841 RepID=UPI003F9B3BE1